MPHEGAAGGLLVVDSYPSVPEARVKRPLQGTLGQRLRSMAEESGGPVAYAHALRCPPKGPQTETATNLVPHIDACRPYLAKTLEVIKPKRIIALGSAAIYSLTGTVLSPSVMRKGFAWLRLSYGWVPVFYGIAPAVASKNKFLMSWLLEDFAEAVTREPLTLPPEPGKTWAKLVETEDAAQQALADVARSDWTAVDCEWAGRPYDKDFKLLCMAFTGSCASVVDGQLTLASPEVGHSWVFTRKGLENPKVVALLKEWLRSPKHKKIGSYFKADTVALHAAFDIWTRGVVGDTRLFRRLMDAEASGKLADMAHLVGRGGHKDELKEAKEQALQAYRKQAKKATGGLFRPALPGMAEQSHADKILAGADPDTYGFAFVDPELLYRYCAADTAITAMLGDLLMFWLSKEPQGMQNVAWDIVVPAGDAYARIESWGMKVDREALQNVGSYLEMQTLGIDERLKPYGYDPADPKGSVFNPASPSKIGELLFKTLKLKSVKDTNTGAQSTDAEALEGLVDQHPVVKDILTWRSLHKMKASYVDSILGYIRDNGRVHPSIHPDGARTGRTSSSNPSLQVIPSVESNDPLQAELAKLFRDCFVPERGHSLLEIDYSQLELRVAADLSGDPEMLQIFIDNKDFHLQTAKLLSKSLWGIEPDQVTDTHRREVKPYAFGLLYDDDPYGLSMRLGVPKEKAEQIKNAVFGCFPMLAKWIQGQVKETAKTGHARTWWGGYDARRRPLVAVDNLDSPAGRTARRGSWNTPIQGTGNEYLVASAIEVVDWIVSNGIPAKLLVTIHDAMLLEVRDDCMSEVYETVLSIMCGHRTKNGVPLAADGKAGKTWASMKKWKRGTPCPIEGCK